MSGKFFLRKISLIFLLAFLLNLVWENWHATLYVHYKNEPITQLVLLRAALFDASFIALLGILFTRFSYFRTRPWQAIVIGVIFAIILELFALQTGRWAYQETMPLVPFIKTGLTPTIQLGLLAYLTFKIADQIYKKKSSDINPTD